MTDKHAPIDAGNGEVFTVEECEPGLFQSVFPSAHHTLSQLHATEADAWDYIAEQRAAIAKAEGR